MQTLRPQFSRLPFKISLKYRGGLYNWYLFPQGRRYRRLVADLRQRGANAYKCDVLWLTHRYDVTWLFLTIIFTLKFEKQEERHVQIEDYLSKVI